MAPDQRAFLLLLIGIETQLKQAKALRAAWKMPLPQGYRVASQGGSQPSKISWSSHIISEEHERAARQ